MRRAFRQFLCATAAALVVVAPQWCSSLGDESDAAAEGGDGQQSHNWTAIAATLEDVGLGLGAARPRGPQLNKAPSRHVPNSKDSGVVMFNSRP